MKYTQKWALISLLEKKDVGYTFSSQHDPLHITLAGVFKIDHDATWLINNLEQLLSNTSCIEIVAGPTALFGPNSDVPVTTIIPNNDLSALHQLLYHWLTMNGAEFNEPQYQDQGYLAHSTIQAAHQLEDGEERTVTSVSLIDLFPDNNGDNRRITATFDLRNIS